MRGEGQKPLEDRFAISHEAVLSSLDISSNIFTDKQMYRGPNSIACSQVEVDLKLISLKAVASIAKPKAMVEAPLTYFQA